jgi:hypothetical protein
MCNACTPKNDPIKSDLVDQNPDLPNGRVLDYRIILPDSTFKLPLDEYMGWVQRTLDRQWSALYDAAKEEYVKYNKGLLDPTEYTKP